MLKTPNLNQINNSGMGRPQTSEEGPFLNKKRSNVLRPGTVDVERR